MKTQLTGFTAYDLRTKLGPQLNVDVAKAIGFAFARVLNAKTVCVGEDARLSSNDLKNGLIKGLALGGTHVHDLGLTVQRNLFRNFSLNFDGGIQVTASHNPKDYNA